jgi:hypothetical protein
MAAENPLHLACPDWGAIDTVWRNPLPFVLWPVGDRPLLADWLDFAVKRGHNPVILYVVDRPAEVRAALEHSDYWSLRVEVRALAREDQFPAEAQRVTHLSSEPELAGSPENGAELLKHWMLLNRHWVERLSEAEVTIYHRDPSGGWIGARTGVHPSARLQAPFWIGPRCEIGAGAVIGPEAVIGEGCLVEEEAEVTDSVVLPRTYVGAHVQLKGRIADGGQLLDPGRAVRVDIAETFILGSTRGDPSEPTVLERMGCLLLWLVLALPALLLGGETTEEEVRHPLHPQFGLRTGSRGPLIVRRWPWLKEVALGRLRWVGVLPRTEAALGGVPEETADRIRAATPGIFSLADSHGVHSTDDPEEWIHAACQALGDPISMRRMVRRDVWRLMWVRPNGESS